MPRRLKRELEVPVIFLTAHADPVTLREATDTEPYGFIVKPFDKRTLAATLQTALRRHNAEQQLAKLERWLAATMTSSGDAVIATDSEYRVALMNPVAEELVGSRAADAMGKAVIDLIRLGNTGAESFSETIARVVSVGAAIHVSSRAMASACASCSESCIAMKARSW